MTNQPISLLDCTLRDGSYAVNFQFTGEHTSNICRELENAGIDWIEVGHGVGLKACELGFGDAAETDLGYMKAASSALKKSKWGMFCIPGIADIDSLKLAIDNGMQFVRIGASFQNYKNSREFIELAREAGLFTCVNFMKSYTATPKEFADCAKDAEDFGANLVYLVDSAGGMLPEEIAQYVSEVKNNTSDLRLGFHGHNNLGLAVANSLKAQEMGVEFLDVSLQGMARGGGNTPAEQFICALMRKGIDVNVDPIALMNIGEKFISPFQVNEMPTSIDVISGLSLFHSSYMGIIKKVSSKHRIDPRKLIVAVCEQDQINAPEELVESLAKKLADDGEKGSWKALYKHYYGKEQ